MEEAAKFALYYFQEEDPTIPRRMQWNEVFESDVEDDIDRFSIFKH